MINCSNPIDPAVLAGKPLVRGLRISVEHVLTTLAAGVPADTSGTSKRHSIPRLPLNQRRLRTVAMS